MALLQEPVDVEEQILVIDSEIVEHLCFNFNNLSSQKSSIGLLIRYNNDGFPLLYFVFMLLTNCQGLKLMLESLLIPYLHYP